MITFLCATKFNPTCNLLADAIRQKGIIVNVKYTPVVNANDLIVNWGFRDVYNSYDAPETLNIDMYYSNKIKFLETELSDEIDEFLQLSFDVEVAKKWLEEDGTVIGRKSANGFGGKDIVVIKNPGQLNNPKILFFTRFFDKTHEFRVHFGRNLNDTYTILDYTQKRKKNGYPESAVWNHNNGYVYSHTKVISKKVIKDCVLNIAQGLSLDFGAMDVMAKCTWNGSKYIVNDFKICEVNFCPGIRCPKTLEAYTNYLTKYHEESNL